MVAKMPLSVVSDGSECMVHSLRRCRDSSRLRSDDAGTPPA